MVLSSNFFISISFSLTKSLVQTQPVCQTMANKLRFWEKVQDKKKPPQKSLIHVGSSNISLQISICHSHRLFILQHITKGSTANRKRLIFPFVFPGFLLFLSLCSTTSELLVYNSIMLNIRFNKLDRYLSSERKKKTCLEVGTQKSVDMQNFQLYK